MYTDKHDLFISTTKKKHNGRHEEIFLMDKNHTG